MLLKIRRVIWIGSLLALTFQSATYAKRLQQERWTEKAANAWYARQPWLVGSNYIPAYAINEIEMWQADTFNPQRIDLELGRIHWTQLHAGISRRPVVGSRRHRI